MKSFVAILITLLSASAVIANDGIVNEQVTSEAMEHGELTVDEQWVGEQLGGEEWMEAPVIAGPIVEGPIVEGPIVVSQFADGQIMEGSVVEGPVVEGPVVEGPVVEGPVVEGPVVGGPTLVHPESVVGCTSCGSSHCSGSDIMQVRNYSLLDYRRMFKRGRTPTSADLVGTWKGVNKGLVRLVGLKQFIKEIQPCGSVMFGDNIDVHQVSDQILRCCGWEPKVDGRTGKLKRNGKYMVQPPTRHGPFGHGVVFSYRDGGNRRLDFRRVIVDKVVVVDCNHLLGRASVRIGLVQVPVGYFVLERM